MLLDLVVMDQMIMHLEYDMLQPEKLVNIQWLMKSNISMEWWTIKLGDALRALLIDGPDMQSNHFLVYVVISRITEGYQ